MHGRTTIKKKCRVILAWYVFVAFLTLTVLKRGKNPKGFLNKYKSRIISK
jgi:hypothetical protein